MVVAKAELRHQSAAAGDRVSNADFFQYVHGVRGDCEFTTYILEARMSFVDRRTHPGFLE